MTQICGTRGRWVDDSVISQVGTCHDNWICAQFFDNQKINWTPEQHVLSKLLNYKHGLWELGFKKVKEKYIQTDNPHDQIAFYVIVDALNIVAYISHVYQIIIKK